MWTLLPEDVSWSLLGTDIGCLVVLRASVSCCTSWSVALFPLMGPTCRP
jgi:hypothetical protein